jgi:hypothetical protein
MLMADVDDGRRRWISMVVVDDRCRCWTSEFKGSNPQAGDWQDEAMLRILSIHPASYRTETVVIVYLREWQSNVRASA